MITIKKLINLCSCAYNFPTYDHALLFQNKESRDAYYNSKVVKQYELSFHYDDLLNDISIPANIKEFKNINYLFFDDKFFFIADKIIVNDNITKLILNLDVLQTYLYDCIFYPSFVERCHVPRVQSNGLPTNEVVAEGLSIGDYIQKESEIICQLSSSCVLSTSTPLGYMEKNTDYNPVD